MSDKSCRAAGTPPRPPPRDRRQGHGRTNTNGLGETSDLGDSRHCCTNAEQHAMTSAFVVKSDVWTIVTAAPCRISQTTVADAASCQAHPAPEKYSILNTCAREYAADTPPPVHQISDRARQRTRKPAPFVLSGRGQGYKSGLLPTAEWGGQTVFYTCLHGRRHVSRKVCSSRAYGMCFRLCTVLVDPLTERQFMTERRVSL